MAPDATEDDLLRGERLYPFDPAAAREEMARSRYDENRDGICDDPACKDVFALETDTGFEKFADRVWVEDLKAIGITLDIRRVADHRQVHPDVARPDNEGRPEPRGVLDRGLPERLESLRHPLHIGGNRGAGLRERVARGSEPHDLRRWGYGVTQVPNVDPEIDKCLAFLGFAQTRCWAELDQLLMARVVPWVPQDTFEFIGVRPERLVRAPVDQALDVWLALDQVALAQPSD